MSDTDPGGCSIGILNFSNFRFTSTTGAAYNATDIELTPSSDGFMFTLNPNLGFPVCSDGLVCFQSTTAGLTVYDIVYTFFIDSGPMGTAADLGMDPPFGNVVINQDYCKDADLMQFSATAAPVCSTGTPQVLSVNNNNPPGSLNTGIVPLVPPILNFANVLTMINLNGVSGFDSSTGNTVITSSSPEPSAIFLVAGGLLAVAFRRRFW